MADHPNLTKALALAKIGFWVFPCYPEDWTDARGKEHKAKSPIPWKGFYESENEEDAIRRLWSRHPDALVGVWTGKSEIIVLDVDQSIEKGKDGKLALKTAGVYLPPTLRYTTRSGGEHHVYAAGDLFLGPTQDHLMEDGRRLNGVDRRSGGSYVVWWGEAPADRSEMLAPPAWFQNDTTTADAEYQGTVDEWMETLAEGSMDPSVASILNRIPYSGFTHGEMIKLQVSLVRAGASGKSGVPEAIDFVREAYLSNGYGTPKWTRLWEQALAGAVARFGGETEPEEELVEEGEEVEPEYYTRYQQTVSATAPISRDDLAQALDVACSRLIANWEELRETDAVADMLRKCVRLLDAVLTEEDATKWLTNTKKFMKRELGEAHG